MATTKTVSVDAAKKTSKKFGEFEVRAHSYSVVENFAGSTPAERFADALSFIGGDPDKAVSLIKTAVNAEAKRKAFQEAGGQDLKLMAMARNGIRAGVFSALGITDDTPENVQKVANSIRAQILATA